VGYYRETKEDFTDHGEKIIIDDEGVKFECQTKPYGFVSPDARVWFQKFQEQNRKGETVIRDYLMTTGYLWTSQFPESSLPVKEGRPQSMEFDRESVRGNWQIDPSNGLELFIINDAVVQKLCILGDDVEPCFEGASVTAPDVSTNFTLDDNFKRTLFTMMRDLENALKGGQQMDKLENAAVQPEQMQEQVQEPADVYAQAEAEPAIQEKDTSAPNEYVKKDDDNKEEKETKEEPKEDKASEGGKSGSESGSKETSNEGNGEKKDDEDEKKAAKKYTEQIESLESKLNALQESYDNLRTQYQALVEFKTKIDNEKKDALIGEFYMLSDEDKHDVIENKEKYTLEDIKAKLSVICFDKKVNFSLSDNANKKEENNLNDVAITYALNSNETDSVLPDWVKAVKQEQENLG